MYKVPGAILSVSRVIVSARSEIVLLRRLLKVCPCEAKEIKRNKKK